MTRFLIVFGLSAFLICIHGLNSNHLQAQKKTHQVSISGSVNDANGKPVASGDVQISFAGTKARLEPFKDGSYKFAVALDPMKLPITIKLTYYSHDKAHGLPRSIEYLAPRDQFLQVVMYTPDQLKKANTGELFAEALQLEAALFDWLQADASFKEQKKQFYSFSKFDERRQIINSRWREIAPKTPIPNKVVMEFSERTSGEGMLFRNMKEFLPKD